MKMMTVGSRNIFITGDTYLYDLIEDDEIEAASVRGKANVIAIYNRYGDAIFVAVVGRPLDNEIDDDIDDDDDIYTDTDKDTDANAGVRYF